MSHNNFDTNCKASGFKGGCAENVAYNFPEGGGKSKDSMMGNAENETGCRGAMQQWRTSQGHYENIMSDNKYGGVGYHVCGGDGKMMFTALFGNN
jgi:uncharacterized protein YkwD